MFGLIKLALIGALLGGGIFTYDFFNHLEDMERVAVKDDIKEFLDSGKLGTLCSSLGGKMNEDFHERFWPKITKAFRVLRSDEEPKPLSMLIPESHRSTLRTSQGSFVQRKS